MKKLLLGILIISFVVNGVGEWTEGETRDYTFNGRSEADSKYNVALDEGNYEIAVHGADGADSAYASGGIGGFINGTFSAESGDTLEIWVGEVGHDGTYNVDGGWGRHFGADGMYAEMSGSQSGAGGGSTEVLLNGDFLAAADAGGGAGADAQGNDPMGGGGARCGASPGEQSDAECPSDGIGYGGDGGQLTEPGKDGGQGAGSALSVDRTENGGSEHPDGTQNGYVEITYLGPTNAPPSFNSQDILWSDIGGSELRKLNYSIGDPDGLDISSHNSPPSGLEETFTNSTFTLSGISSQFDYLAQITDFAGASDTIGSNFTLADTSYRESDYTHSLSGQRVNLSATIENRGDSANYSLSMSNPDSYSSIIQGTSWSGSLSSGEITTKTGIWEGEWVTGETESSYNKYSDSGFDHGEDQQQIVNRTELEVSNSRSFTFHGVDISGVCSQTSSVDVPSGSNQVTTDCNRPTFSVDFISQSVGSEYEDLTYGHSLGSQGVARDKQLTETGGFEFSGVNVSSPSISGTCSNCGQREVDISASSTVTEVYNATGDWITGLVETTYSKYESSSYDHDEDAQGLVNQTELLADNIQSFSFSSVDISTECSQTSSAGVPSGDSVSVSTDCNRPTFTVDLIDSNVGSEEQDTSKSADLQTQYLELDKNVSETGGYSWSSVTIRPPSIDGTCSDCGNRSRDFETGETLTETYHSSGDWIADETESSDEKYEDAGFDHGEDEQVLVNQTQIVVDNERSFAFSGVDISSICSQTGTADVPSGTGVTATQDCNRPTFTVDFIDESVGSLAEDSTVGHDLGVQGVARQKNLSETGGYSWSQVNVSAPLMPGSCENCGERKVDVDASSTSSVFYNSTGDWLDSSIEVFERGQYGAADLDQQSFYNQTQLQVDNSRDVAFESVDLSSKCSVTTSADIPSGTSTVTTSCTNQTFSGDWIQNEENESTRFVSGSVVIGDGVSEMYRAGQNVSAVNERSDVDLSVDFSREIVEEQGCSVVDSVRSVPSASSSEFSFEKLCSPGEVTNHEPVEKTETATDFKYTYNGEFQVYTNLTEEQPITFAVERSRLSNFEERMPTETEVYIDGRGDGLSVDQRYFNDTEYVTVQVPDDFGNSSLHEGSHSVELVYYESKSPGGTSGGGSTGGGAISSGSGTQETVENVTGEYNWTVSAAVSSDTQQFTVARAPGDSFEKQILLRNIGSSEVPLNISCTSQDGFCRYIDFEVDRVVLNTGSFSQKQVTVSGNVPTNASAGSSYTFRVLVEDPSSTGLNSEGAATVDFLVTVSDFWGGIISYATKLTEMRELESPFEFGSSIPYPFALLPVLSAALAGGVSWGLRRLFEVKASTKVQVLEFALVVFVFLVSVPLWP